jgi:hypothetical protein
MPLDLIAMRVWSHLVALDNHLVHKKAPLDSTTIHPKPAQVFLYLNFDQ